MHPAFRPTPPSRTHLIPGHEITRLHVLAEKSAKHAKSTLYARYLYVIEVKRLHPSIDFDFYVGQTGRTPEVRLDQHRNGYKAAKCFRGRKALPMRLRYDLMHELPRFFTADAVLEAEELLAGIITTYVGPAHCN